LHGFCFDHRLSRVESQDDPDVFAEYASKHAFELQSKPLISATDADPLCRASSPISSRAT